MQRLAKGKQVLRQAEQALQEILVDSAANGDYESLTIVASWTQEIASLLRGESPIGSAMKQRVSTLVKEDGDRRGKKRKKRAKRYPKFVRNGDYLVKIGWSKSDNSEYEHKANMAAIRAVVSSLSKVGRKGTRFTMDAVLPLKDLDGSEIPDYQSYLILAWLRKSDLIKQHGRLGYTLIKDIDLVEATEQCWDRLKNQSYSETS